ncbi:MAG: hypothetical protein ACFFD2_26110 [Promethearchaeota archaeon]
MKYVTAQEIDGVTGIKSPHARELEELDKSKVDLFVKNKKRRIKIIMNFYYTTELHRINH